MKIYDNFSEKTTSSSKSNEMNQMIEDIDD